jgi:hypothetical protein
MLPAFEHLTCCGFSGSITFLLSLPKRWANTGLHTIASVIELLVEDIDRLAREVKDMRPLPPVTKCKIGFIIGED